MFTNLGLWIALYSLIKETRVVCYALQGDAIFLAGAYTPLEDVTFVRTNLNLKRRKRVIDQSGAVLLLSAQTSHNRGKFETMAASTNANRPTRDPQILCIFSPLENRTHLIPMRMEQ